VAEIPFKEFKLLEKSLPDRLGRIIQGFPDSIAVLGPHRERLAFLVPLRFAIRLPKSAIISSTVSKGP